MATQLSSQDYFFLDNNNNNDMNSLLYNNEFSYNNLQQQQLQQLQQQKQQYLVNLQNMQKRNFCCVNDNVGFTVLQQQPTKKQKFVNNQSTTTTTTTSTTTSDNHIHGSMSFSESLSFELEKQRQEIDKYITLQNERLKLAIQEQRKQQMRLAIKKFEAKAMQLLRQKDNEISEATKKSIEFQEMIRKLEVENQAWQRVALETEQTVLSLNNTLQHLQQQQQEQQTCTSSSSSNCVADNESCCNNISNDDNNNLGNEQARNVLDTNKTCKVCNTRKVCMLMLPCRHLCCCKSCDSVIDACPVCKSPKMASFEALFS